MEIAFVVAAVVFVVVVVVAVVVVCVVVVAVVVNIFEGGQCAVHQNCFRNPPLNVLKISFIWAIFFKKCIFPQTLVFFHGLVVATNFPCLILGQRSVAAITCH